MSTADNLLFLLYFAGTACLFGALLGSFFNVLIYRLPRNESIVFPGSHCPSCGYTIRWYENIPVISYLFLRGKCHGCKTAISIRYPLVEMLTSVYSVFIVLFYCIPFVSTQNYDSYGILFLVAFIHYITLLLFVVITIIDIQHYIIPDELTLYGFGIAVLLSFLPGGITPVYSILGAITGSGILLLFGFVGGKLLKRDDAMGGGDVKLLLWFGALWGPFIVLGSIFIGALLATLVSVVCMVLKKLDKGNHIPFGPYLCGGTLIALIYGERIWDWYLKFSGF